MKSARLFLAAVMAGRIVGLPVTTQAVDRLPAPASVPAGFQQPERLAAMIQSIQQAAEPSAAIQAYAEAQAAVPNDLGIEHAYVRRMVEFGLPEMADTQAQDLIKRSPQDGLAWSVAAYMSAKRDQTALALSDISTAVRLLPQDPFVLRTAGQLVAWFDTRPDNAQLPEDVNGSVTALRRQLDGNPIYTDAYRSAADAYKDLAEAPATQPGAASAAPKPGLATQPEYERDEGTVSGGIYTYTPPSTVYNTSNDYYEPYAAPYYAAYPTYDYGWRRSYWGASWWWPTFGSVVIVDRDFRHNHHDRHFNDFDFFHRHGDDEFRVPGRGMADSRLTFRHDRDGLGRPRGFTGTESSWRRDGWAGQRQMLVRPPGERAGAITPDRRAGTGLRAQPGAAPGAVTPPAQLQASPGRQSAPIAPQPRLQPRVAPNASTPRPPLRAGPTRDAPTAAPQPRLAPARPPARATPAAPVGATGCTRCAAGRTCGRPGGIAVACRARQAGAWTLRADGWTGRRASGWRRGSWWRARGTLIGRSRRKAP